MRLWGSFLAPHAVRRRVPAARRRRYAGVVGRDADRQQVPAPMRRDVRLLGDLLGEVIRESGGQGLLDDVERLRRAVIDARLATSAVPAGAPGPGAAAPGGGGALDEI